jgi:hypothetical protein
MMYWLVLPGLYHYYGTNKDITEYLYVLVRTRTYQLISSCPILYTSSRLADPAGHQAAPGQGIIE